MKNTVRNIKQAETVTGIPAKHISTCIVLNADGINANGTINCEKLKGWYEQNKEKVLSQLGNDDELSITEINRLIKLKDLRLKELAIKEKEKNLIEPEEVKQLLVSIATAQSAVLKRIKSELPPRVAGKSEPDCKIEVDKAIDEVFSIFTGKIEEWK